MGKTIKKNQVRKVVRSVYGGTYIVRGQKFPIQNATAANIAADMADRGYRSGATAKWNGGAYRLELDPHYGNHSLIRED